MSDLKRVTQEEMKYAETISAEIQMIRELSYNIRDKVVSLSGVSEECIEGTDATKEGSNNYSESIISELREIKRTFDNVYGDLGRFL